MHHFWCNWIEFTVKSGAIHLEKHIYFKLCNWNLWNFRFAFNWAIAFDEVLFGKRAKFTQDSSDMVRGQPLFVIRFGFVSIHWPKSIGTLKSMPEFKPMAANLDSSLISDDCMHGIASTSFAWCTFNGNLPDALPNSHFLLLKQLIDFSLIHWR